MIITTAKNARAVAQAWARPIGAPLAIAALLLAPAARADWKFTPTLDLRQTYSDNVGLQSDANARNQLITTIAPGLRVRHNGPRLVLNGRFEYEYFHMTDKDIPGTTRNARYLNADAKARLIDDLFYVDASADIRRRAISSFGPISNNAFYTANQAEIKSWSVSPYLVHRFGATANTELRYTRDSVDGGASQYGSSASDSIALRLDSGPAFNNLAWGLALSHQKIDYALTNDSAIKTANANLRYIVTPRFSLTTGIGYDDFDYQSLGRATRGQAWNAGFIYTPSRRTSLTASIGHRYFGPSRVLKALHRSRYTAWSISYDDSVATTRDNFLRSSAVNTGDLLDGFFATEYPDPQARARAIEAYILATGLPPTVGNDVNYLTNRFSLQKQLRASMAYKQSRTGATVSLFRVRREALSVREMDSALLGNALDTLNDNVDQKGINASADYRLTARTRLNLAAEISHSASLVDDRRARNNSLSFSARHQLRARMSGTVELRRVQGSVLGGQKYTENSVSAILSMQL